MSIGGVGMVAILEDRIEAVGALKNRYIRDDVNRTKQALYAA
jgi:hypothetical protein